MTVKTITTKAQFEYDQSPVAMLVQVASHYESCIHLKQGNKSVNAKSIMGMMTMTFEGSEVITIEAEGKDEEQAVEGIAAQLTDD